MAAPMIKSLHSIQTQSGMNLDYVVYMSDGLSGDLHGDRILLYTLLIKTYKKDI